MDDPVIVFGDDQSAHADRAWLNNQRWPEWSVEIITAERERREVCNADPPIRLHEWTPDSPTKAFAETGITRYGTRAQPSARFRVVRPGSRTEVDVVVVTEHTASALARCLACDSGCLASLEHVFRGAQSDVEVLFDPRRFTTGW
jgi:hypothetical protein